MDEEFLKLYNHIGKVRRLRPEQLQEHLYPASGRLSWVLDVLKRIDIERSHTNSTPIVCSTSVIPLEVEFPKLYNPIRKVRRLSPEQLQEHL